MDKSKITSATTLVTSMLFLGNAVGWALDKVSIENVIVLGLISITSLLYGIKSNTDDI